MGLLQIDAGQSSAKNFTSYTRPIGKQSKRPTNAFKESWQ